MAQLKILFQLFLFISFFTLTIESHSQESNFLKVKVSVAPEMKSSFQKGGIVYLRINRQPGREPRNSTEVSIGVINTNWDGNHPFVFTSDQKNLIPKGSELLSGSKKEKFYCQIFYKQDRDDCNESYAENLYSKVDSFILAKEVNINLTLTSKIQPLEVTKHELVKTVIIQSKYLTRFFGRLRSMTASILLPASFSKNPEKSFPICYRAPGLGGRSTRINDILKDKEFMDWWYSKEAPQIVYVFLDSRGPFGDTYQVDSENNGPCGKALTEELMPAIEKVVHYDPASKKRFIAGLSTGGWVALGLQIFYPDFFDGSYSYSPDPLEFEHFGLINIYQDFTIFYNKWGYLQPGVRTIYDEPTRSMKDWIAGENRAGWATDYRTSGGQFGAYNAVFGPRGKDGLPTLMFDPVTGKIDHSIARKWEKYDLKKVLEKNWSTLGPKLQGKIWIWSGDSDDLYSNVATRFFKLLIDKTENPKSDAIIRFTPMAEHCEEWDDQAVIMMIGEKTK